MKQLITVGSKTTHGATISNGDFSFLIEGKAVHLEGMTHYCPLCKTTSTAISSGKGFMMVGDKTIIMANDKATCGASFIPSQNLVLRVSGSGGSSANNLLNLVSAVSNLFDSSSFSESFVLVDRVTNEILANTAYKIHRANGDIEEGITDNEGKTKKITSNKNEEIHIEIVDSEFDI